MTFIDRKEPLPPPSPPRRPRALPEAERGAAAPAAGSDDVDPSRVPLPASEASGPSLAAPGGSGSSSEAAEQRQRLQQQEAERYVFAHDTANETRLAPPPSYGSIVGESSRSAHSRRTGVADERAGSSGYSAGRRSERGSAAGEDPIDQDDEEAEQEQDLEYAGSSRRSRRATRSRRHRHYSPSPSLSPSASEAEDADIGPTEATSLLSRARSWVGSDRQRRRRKEKRKRPTPCVLFLRVFVVVVLLAIIIDETVSLFNPDLTVAPPEPYTLARERGAELVRVFRLGPAAPAERLNDPRIPHGKVAVRQEIVLDPTSSSSHHNRSVEEWVRKNFLVHTVGQRFVGHIDVKNFSHPWISWQNSTGSRQASVNITAYSSSHFPLEAGLTLAQVRTADGYSGLTLASDDKPWRNLERYGIHVLIDIALPLYSLGVSLDVSSDTMDVELGSSDSEHEDPPDEEVPGRDRYQAITVHTGTGNLVYWVSMQMRGSSLFLSFNSHRAVLTSIHARASQTLVCGGDTTLSTVTGDITSMGLLASRFHPLVAHSVRGAMRLGAMNYRNITLTSDAGPISASLAQAQDLKVRSGAGSVDMTIAPFRSVDILTSTGDVNARVLMALVGKDLDADEPRQEDGHPSASNSPAGDGSDTFVPLLQADFASTLGAVNIRYDQQRNASLSSKVHSRLGKVNVEHAREFQGTVRISSQTRQMTEVELGDPARKVVEMDDADPAGTSFTARVFLKGGEPHGRGNPMWSESQVSVFVAPIHVVF